MKLTDAPGLKEALHQVLGLKDSTEVIYIKATQFRVQVKCPATETSYGSEHWYTVTTEKT